MLKTMTALQMLTLATASLTLAACGGGSTDSANDGEVFGLTSTSITTQALPAQAKKDLPDTVQLEGCVVDALWLSAPGVVVHARSSDGRAVGSSVTDARGVFMLKVPARAAIVVATDWAGPGELMLNTGSQSLSVAACLPSTV